jgi:hypothetical protein
MSKASARFDHVERILQLFDHTQNRRLTRHHPLQTTQSIGDGGDRQDHCADADETYHEEANNCVHWRFPIIAVCRPIVVNASIRCLVPHRQKRRPPIRSNKSHRT